MTARETTRELGGLRERMAHEITRRGGAVSADAANEPVLRRVAVPVSGVDALAWLNRQADPRKLYWGSRDRAFESAGIGAAHALTADDIEACPRILEHIAHVVRSSDAGLRYYGGMRFYGPYDADSTWKQFPPVSFVVPRFELTRLGRDTRLVCNISGSAAEEEIDNVLSELDRLVFIPPLPENPFPAPHDRRDVPDRDAWTRMIDRAVGVLRDGELEKIVLARRATMEFDQGLSPIALLRRLKAVTPDCFHFCFQPVAGEAFVGATPERLYRRDGRQFESEAVAGTRPRGGTMFDDTELGRALLDSDKDQREHTFVRDAIREALEPICRTLEVAHEAELLKLARGQHLFTGARGELAGGITDAELLARLHPTPAVGGCPTVRAIELLRAWEGFDRGWYAAPVGWLGEGAAEFAVAIRSALVHGSQLSLFSGAGIVEGSTPDGEWEEIENKSEDFISILTGVQAQ